MSTPSEQIDWPGIRQAAAIIGIRAAARAAASNLSPREQLQFFERVKRRASREGWEAAKKAVIAKRDMMSPHLSPPCPQGLLLGTESVAVAVANGDVSPGGLLTMHERRARLAKIVRTPVGEVDENSPLAQKLKRDKDGNVIEISMPDKLKALEMDAQFAGELVQRSETAVAGVILQVTPENRAETLKAVKAWEREQGIPD